MDIKTFISYAATDENKKIVGDLKKRLDEFGLNVFAAHDDIGGGKQWVDKIIEEIRECDLFLALITKEYHERGFTEQELGMAIYAGKPTICITVDNVSPKGFAETLYQYVPYIGVDETAKKVTIDALELFKITDRIDFAIQHLAVSRHFDDSNTLAQLLDPNVDLTESQATCLAHAFNENDQVHYASHFANDHVARILYRHQNLLKLSLWRTVKDVCAEVGIDLYQQQ